jgi:2-oxoglutarate dehydrogenase E2 component (dihydrolipoamide succinyltransferase)
MKIEIKVPAMGESITEAVIGNILKPNGSLVNPDEEILELETDKVNQVIYAPQAGIITFMVSPGQTVKIGEVIGAVETEKKQNVPEPVKQTVNKEASQKPWAQKEPQSSPPTLQPPIKKKEEGLVGARVTKEAFLEDLLSKEVSEPPPFIAPKPTELSSKFVQSQENRTTRKTMSRVRRVIAERLVEAQRTTAMLTTFNEADMTQIISLREKYKEQFIKEHGVRLGFMPFFVKAAVSALQEFPECNSFIDGEDMVHREYYDIGVAVGTEKGVFVPVVRDCDKKSFAQIEGSIEEYAKKAKDGTITVDDLQGGGFTITNGGIYGSLLSTPILNPPQCAILGMHKISKRPVVIDDQIVIRPMMYLALSYDHRLIDGKQAVSFLVHVKNLLEDPSRILLNIS